MNLIDKATKDTDLPKEKEGQEVKVKEECLVNELNTSKEKNEKNRLEKGHLVAGKKGYSGKPRQSNTKKCKRKIRRLQASKKGKVCLLFYIKSS